MAAARRSSSDLVEEKRVKKCSSNNCYLDNVEDYVLIEILKRLPTKLAHQCKSVSKRWLNAISTQYFISKYYKFHHSHLDQSIPASALIFYQSNRDGFCIRHTNSFKLDLLLFDRMASRFSFDTLAPPPQSPPYNMFTVLSANNGLVLCATKPIAYAQRYFVCNPLSKMWLPIPRAPTADKAHVGFLCQAPFFSLNKNTSAGSEDISYSFRIVRLMEIDGVMKVEIYASEMGQWTEHILDNNADSDHFKHVLPRTRSVTCNGLLYWQTGKALIFMDPYKCQFGAVKLPQFRHGQTLNCYFGECRGKVRGVQYFEESLTIWELEDCDIDAREWSLVREINLVYEIRPSSIIFHPFNEDALFFIVRGQIVLYHITKKITRVIWGTTNNNLITSFPIVLPWPPLSKSPHKNSKTANNFEASLMMSKLNSDYSSIPIDQDYPQSSASDFSGESGDSSDSD